MDQLVADLEKYSPLRQIEEDPSKGDITGTDIQKVSADTRSSPAPGKGEFAENTAVETDNYLGGDGGGSVSIVPKYFKPLRTKAGLCHQLPHLKIILTSSRILQRSHKLIHYISLL
jgi:hypothetical protein